MKQITARTLFAIAIIPVGLLSAFLFVQDQRQGWPFSRHTMQDSLATRSEARALVENIPVPALARVPVELPTNQVAMIGVEYEPVAVSVLDDPVRAVATVVADESRIVHVHTRVAGWLEELLVNTTGEYVRAGQPLGGVFSQELYSSQSEYLSALRRTGSGPASAVLEAAHTRLKLLGMSDAEIARIGRDRRGTPPGHNLCTR
ncbi:MAG: efflux RND transporter periplasmic adaptor subunit [Proteobacteria bacterium]|nr:efflux RND transporter periplasmic adaptor subunit [Pseudomonadota bacterium]